MTSSFAPFFMGAEKIIGRVLHFPHHKSYTALKFKIDIDRFFSAVAHSAHCFVLE